MSFFCRALPLVHEGGEGCWCGLWRGLKVQIEGLLLQWTSVMPQCIIVLITYFYLTLPLEAHAGPPDVGPLGGAQCETV